MILHFNNNGVLVRAEGTLSEANRKLLIKLLTEYGGKIPATPACSDEPEGLRKVVYDEVLNYIVQVGRYPRLPYLITTVRNLSGASNAVVTDAVQQLLEKNVLHIRDGEVHLVT